MRKWLRAVDDAGRKAGRGGLRSDRKGTPEEERGQEEDWAVLERVILQAKGGW